MVNMDEINPMASGGDMMRQSSAPGYPGSHPSNNDRMGPQRNTNANVPSVPGNNSAASMPQNRNDPEWKIRVRHKQQRLLLLHHSAKCPHEGGHCPITPHCADMKRLWRHMEACKDNNCRVSHCFSSRAILSHYRKCKDSNCPACGPVRDTVRRSRGSTARPSASTGPMMNEMRGVPPAAAQPPPQPPPPPQPQQHAPPPPQQHPQQHQGRMPSSSDPFNPNGGGGSSHLSMSSSVGSSSFPPQRQPGHSTMPPPVSGHNGSSSAMPPYSNQSQSSSQYRPSISSGQGPPGGSVQSNYSSEPHKPMPPSVSMPSSSSTRVSENTSAGLSSGFSASHPGTAPSGGGKNDSEWQKIRHKQQRLLLLRHASRCQHEAGKCPVTAHCASMKKLWEHIAHCRNQQCTVQHCLSSRYVLSHYRRCKDARCPACGPVRDTIRKSHEREQSRHEQSGSIDPPPSLDDDKLMGVGGRDESFDARDPGPPSATSSRSSPAELYPQDKKRLKTEHEAPPKSVPSVASAPPVQQVVSKKVDAVKSVPVATKKVASKTDTKPNVDHSLLNSFTVRELETHLASLDRKTQLPPAKLKAKCLDVLKGLQTHHHGWVFNCPVDPVELGLPDYFEIIKKPMDLGSIQKRLENGAYHAIEDFQSDVNLTFENAMTYNEDGSVVYDMAKELKTKVEVDMKKLVTVLETEDKERRQNERACTLCGCEKLLFEPPVYFCNGMNCQSQRIRRNSHFYIGGNNQYFWCSTCYNELDEKIPIELVDMTITKPDLKKKKNDEIHEESWVQCDTCERWVHQICGLFNTRQNKEHHSEYCCPECLVTKKKKSPNVTPSPSPPGAVDLPRTTLSEWLEQHINKRIGAKKRQLAEDKAKAEVRMTWLVLFLDEVVRSVVRSNTDFHVIYRVFHLKRRQGMWNLVVL
jgi:E1A/CREB-binding protein